MYVDPDGHSAISLLISVGISLIISLENGFHLLVGGAVGGLIGYGIGEGTKYLTAKVQTAFYKNISKKANSTINKIFNNMGADTVNIGMKNSKEIVYGLYKANKNRLAQVLSSLSSAWF